MPDPNDFLQAFTLALAAGFFIPDEDGKVTFRPDLAAGFFKDTDLATFVFAADDTDFGNAALASDFFGKDPFAAADAGLLIGGRPRLF